MTISGMRNSPTSIAKHSEFNELVEKLCKILYIVMVYISVPIILLPKTVISLYTYYTTDIEGDAFQMPFPMS